MKSGVFPPLETLVLQTEPTGFFTPLKKNYFCVFDMFSSFLAVVPEAGDLLRREGPGLLDAVCLMAEEREYDFMTRHSAKQANSVKGFDNSSVHSTVAVCHPENDQHFLNISAQLSQTDL